MTYIRTWMDELPASWSREQEEDRIRRFWSRPLEALRWEYQKPEGVDSHFDVVDERGNSQFDSFSWTDSSGESRTKWLADFKAAFDSWQSPLTDSGSNRLVMYAVAQAIRGSKDMTTPEGFAAAHARLVQLRAYASGEVEER